MDRMMHLHHHHHHLCTDQPDAATANGTRSSASVSVSQVAFMLAAVAFLSLFSSSLASSPLPSGAALSARLVALCGFVRTKKALFVLSNAIFLFLAADCRCCFFSGVCGVATPSTSDDVVIADSEMPSSTLQVQPSCRLYCCSNTKSASADCSGEQEEAPVSSRQVTAGIEAEEATIVTLDLETATCGGVAQEEVEKLEMDELNRKFEDFIQSRRIKWLQEEEALLCQQQQIV